MSYKILSLDGGGSWALIQARVLKDLYGDIEGHEFLREFDLVIANSGGSLVLAALCNNMTLSEIIEVFKDETKRKKIFSVLKFDEKLTKRNFLSLFRESFKIGPKYKAERKLKGLIEVLKDYDDPSKGANDPSLIVNTPLDKLPRIIGKSTLQIIIVGFDYYRARATFFRSNPDSATDKFSMGKHYQISLAHAIHASSNAPVNYFDDPAEVSIISANKKDKDKRKGKYWDGAVAGFNNPVLAGLVEAITNETKRNLSEFKILSIGTGISRKAIIADYKDSDNKEYQLIYENNKDNPLASNNDSPKFMQDVSKMAQSILSDPPNSATFIAYSILNPSLTNNGNIVRINPCITPELDDKKVYIIPKSYLHEGDVGRKKFMQLLEMDMDAIEEDQVALIDDFCKKFISKSASPLPNQLIRGDGKPGGVFLGQATYKAAKSKWLELNNRNAGNILDGSEKKEHLDKREEQEAKTQNDKFKRWSWLILLISVAALYYFFVRHDSINIINRHDRILVRITTVFSIIGSLSLVALVLFVIVWFLGTQHCKYGVFNFLIGDEGSYSLSRLQAVLWAVVIIGYQIAVIVALLLNKAISDPFENYQASFSESSVWLLGLSLSSYIAVKSITTEKIKEGTIIRNSKPEVRWKDIVVGQNGLDFAKCQMLIWTVIAIFAYLSKCYYFINHLLVGDYETIIGMFNNHYNEYEAAGNNRSLTFVPYLPWTFVVLMGLSQGAYVGKKLVPSFKEDEARGSLLNDIKNKIALIDIEISAKQNILSSIRPVSEIGIEKMRQMQRQIQDLVHQKKSYESELGKSSV